jgi:hypothetical protein
MNTRANPFAGLTDLTEPPAFSPKPKPEKPIEKASVARMAEEQGFPSREAPKATRAPRRKPRIYRTGRNQQFNAKVTSQTFDRIYKAAETHGVTLGRLLEMAMDALEHSAEHNAPGNLEGVG